MVLDQDSLLEYLANALVYAPKLYNPLLVIARQEVVTASPEWNRALTIVGNEFQRSVGCGDVTYFEIQDVANTLSGPILEWIQFKNMKLT
jgi:hypothetical protein